MTLKKTKFETIDGIRSTFAAHNFSNEDLYELVNPNLGIITGFSDPVSYTHLTLPTILLV